MSVFVEDPTHPPPCDSYRHGLALLPRLKSAATETGMLSSRGSKNGVKTRPEERMLMPHLENTGGCGP